MKDNYSNRKLSLIVMLIIFSPLLLWAQIAVGGWRDHLPYTHAYHIAIAENKIYCSTGSGLFILNTLDNSIEKLSRVNGLSDIGISALRYNATTKTLAIGYSNGNLDIIKENIIYNISDIKRKPISGSKSINNITFINNQAYLSCGFGIVIVDIFKNEIKDTYFIGPNATQLQIFDITTDNSFIYAATNSGIYKANLNNPNLIDYQNWQQITNIPNYNKPISSIAYCYNKIYYNVDLRGYAIDTLFWFNNTESGYLDTTSTFRSFYYRIETSNNKLIVSCDHEVRIYDNQNTITDFYWNYYFSLAYPRSALLDNSGLLWIADVKNGLVRIGPLAWMCTPFYPNGPNTDKVTDIAANGGYVWAVPGSVNASWSNTWTPGEAYFFYNQQWFNKSQEFSGIDFITCHINPYNTAQVFVGSWGNGVFEFYNGQFVKQYTDSNSTLQSVIPGGPYLRIGGLAVDENQNLWVTNSHVTKQISVKTPEGKWYAFDYNTNINASTIGKIIVTKKNHKWVILPRGGGLFVFDDKGTFDNISDDNTKKLSVIDENGSLISNDVYSIAEDKDENIWIGTNKGAVVYYNPQNVFTEEKFYASQIIVTLDNIAQYLLETETVTAIAIDGANRKWFGTESSGVFMMNESCTQQLLHFNTENSPLLSNTITAIAIDPQSGEVFFGTDKGIISYRSTATEPEENFNQVYVFPNPVRQNYTGVITVHGLVANCNVKFTDIAGNIVYECKSEGGQAIWNGNDFSGRRVHTGVYLIFCTNQDGSKTHITKLLFIN